MLKNTSILFIVYSLVVGGRGIRNCLMNDICASRFRVNYELEYAVSWRAPSFFAFLLQDWKIVCTCTQWAMQLKETLVYPLYKINISTETAKVHARVATGNVVWYLINLVGYFLISVWGSSCLRRDINILINLLSVLTILRTRKRLKVNQSEEARAICKKLVPRQGSGFYGPAIHGSKKALCVFIDD